MVSKMIAGSPVVLPGALRLWQRARRVVAALGFAALGAGCGGSRGTGSARIEAWAVNGASFARVFATVSRGDGSDFSPIAAELQRNGAEWWGQLDAIPAGSRRRFDLVGYDSTGAALSSVTTYSDIAAGGVQLVSVLLEQQVPAPVIDALTVTPSEVAPGGVAHVSAAAHDPAGGPLTFHWSATCGSVDDADAAAATWTAPGSEMTCRLSVTVTSSAGASITASLDVDVQQGTGAVETQVQLNRWPVISAFAANVALGAAMEGDLKVTASDPDGDPVTYLWTSTCPELVFNLDAPYAPSSPHFWLPGPSGACQVHLTVEDPSGGHASAVLKLPSNGALDGGA